MRTKEEIDRLVEENIKLVNYVINRYYKQFKSIYPYLVDDLYQEGCIGLFKAAKNHDESKGAFSTIATLYIKSYMHNFATRYVNKHYSNNTCNFEKTIYNNGDSNELTLLDMISINDEIKDDRIDLINIRANNSSIKYINTIVKMTERGYSQREIGEVIGIPQSNVSRRLKSLGEEILVIDKLMEILYKNKVS
ncbi:sigma-70 family RNA polymerase sigma factor [Faecalimicrobium sp. JNUCC 81]